MNFADRIVGEQGEVMNVAFFHDHSFVQCGSQFHSRSGLPQGVLQRYANAFGSVNVVCRSTYSRHTHLDPIDDARITFCPQPNLRSLGGLRHYWRVSNEIEKIVASADLVIGRLPSTLGRMGVQEARRQGKVYAVEVVGNAFEATFYHGSRLGFALAHLEHSLTARAILESPHAIYITERYLQQVYPTRGNEYICANVSVVPASSGIVENRIQRRCSSSRCRVGLIGSLDVNYKGHGVALRCAKILRDEYGFRDVELHFAGPGDPYRWRKLSTDLGLGTSVVFEGSIPPGKEMMAWIDTLDVLLQPSRVEAQGRSIIEAMSRGCPVVASNVGGIPELLDPEVISDPDDVGGLGCRVRQMLEQHEFYGAQARRNWQYAHTFSAETLERRRSSIFQLLRTGAEGGR